MRRPLTWLVLAVLGLVAGWAGGRIGLPSSYLFGALVAGLVIALSPAPEIALPRWSFVAAQAALGVVLGAYMQSSTLSAVGASWAPVLLVSLATLAVTIAAGLVLGRFADVDRATASMGMIAGGASGIVAIADELGADDRLVAFMQYLRVLLIVALTPVAVRILFPGHAAAPGGSGEGPLLGTAGGWALTAGAAVVGALAASAVRLPAGMLLGPLLLTAALTLSGTVHHFTVPALVRDAGFMVIGAQVGLRFTVGALRAVRRLLLPVVASIAGLVVACAGLAWLLSVTAGVSYLDAYLATTPGGLYAVLATAFGSGANTTFVLAVQGLRLLVMVLAAPAVVRLLLARSPGRPVADTT